MQESDQLECIPLFYLPKGTDTPNQSDVMQVDRSPLYIEQNGENYCNQTLNEKVRAILTGGLWYMAMTLAMKIWKLYIQNKNDVATLLMDYTSCRYSLMAGLHHNGKEIQFV